MHKGKLRLHPGYKLRVADFMEYVELAENFTLGDLCQMILDFDEMDIETFSALLQCPLEPFIEECLMLSDGIENHWSDLHHIRLSWSCEYDSLTETRWPPSTSLWLHVDAIGEIWDDYKAGGQFYEEGKDYTDCNRYAIEMTPLYKLRHLPIRIDPIMTICPSPTQDERNEPLEIPAPDVTLLQFVYHLFWEFSFFGTPEERDAESEELHELRRRIEAGEEKLIPLEEIENLWRGSETEEGSTA